METWKPVQGFEGNYLISDRGRVWNLRTNKIRLGYLNNVLGIGYYKISLYKNGKKHLKSIHALIAQAFIDNPDNKPQVHHVNADKLDNRIENLMWVTIEEHGNLTRKDPDHLVRCRIRRQERNERKEQKRIETRKIVEDFIKARTEKKNAECHCLSYIDRDIVKIEN